MQPFAPQRGGGEPVGERLDVRLRFAHSQRALGQGESKKKGVGAAPGLEQADDFLRPAALEQIVGIGRQQKIVVQAEREGLVEKPVRRSVVLEPPGHLRQTRERPELRFGARFGMTAQRSRQELVCHAGLSGRGLHVRAAAGRPQLACVLRERRALA